MIFIYLRAFFRGYEKYTEEYPEYSPNDLWFEYPERNYEFKRRWAGLKEVWFVFREGSFEYD